MEEGQGHLKNEERMEKIYVANKRIKARQLEILEEESAREVSDRELHELRIKGENILAADLRIK